MTFNRVGAHGQGKSHCIFDRASQHVLRQEVEFLLSKAVIGDYLRLQQKTLPLALSSREG